VRTSPGAPITFGITGASGAPYAVRLLRALCETATPLRLIVSTYGWRLLAEESGIDGLEALQAATGDWSRVELYDSLDRGATPAS
jgi:4-hydroxy-3-polyprenylbenzoate decarboxylase